MRTLTESERQLIRDSGLFDAAWYAEKYRDVAATGLDPLDHFLRIGIYIGRNPCALFDGSYYLSHFDGFTARPEIPLIDYLQEWWRHNRNPQPLFDLAWYFERNEDIRAAGIEPLAHFRCHGGLEGRQPHPAFPTYRVLERCPHLRELCRNPLEFYLSKDWAEDPCPEATAYLSLSRASSSTRHACGLLAKPLEHIPKEKTHTAGQVATDIRAIAIYLPQFHAIPENDAWWGRGFTEWTNVRRATPQYEGHYQPHIPHPDIGYYDLNDASVLEKQAAMARAAGIEGFCFYYYWFNGRRLLNMPTDRLLATGKPDFPFCFCWANENWTRTWDGGDTEILLGQEHSHESDERFILDLLPTFRDPRYIRVEGKPLLIVYRPGLLPDPAATARHWRDTCRREGVGEIFLSFMLGFDAPKPFEIGFDAAIQMPPLGCGVPVINSQLDFHNPIGFAGQVRDYRQAAAILPSEDYGVSLWPAIFPSWDNTARRMERAHSWVYSSPEIYYEWLSILVRRARQALPTQRRFVFINAWNEWAEGCHLEPDEKYGYAWLNATYLALTGLRSWKQPHIQELARNDIPTRSASAVTLSRHPTVVSQRRNRLLALLGGGESREHDELLINHTALLSIFRQNGYSFLYEDTSLKAMANGEKRQINSIGDIAWISQAIWGQPDSIPWCFILLQYNNWQHTQKCVESIRQLKKTGAKIYTVIVDNASSAETIEKTESLFGHDEAISLIFNSENLGFSKGNNIGFQYAKERFGSGFFVVVNNDVVFEDADFIAKSTALYREWSYSVLGPDIVTPDGRHENPWNDYIYDINEWKTLNGLFEQQKQNYIQTGHAEFKKIGERHPEREVILNPLLQGACFIFSPIFVSCHSQPFDESSFLYGEEFPLAAEGLLSGHLSIYSSKIAIRHEEGVSSSLIPNNEKMMNGYNGALAGIQLALFRLGRQSDCMEGDPLAFDLEHIRKIASDGRKHILFDLFFCQPGFHGGGEYGKAIFRGLVEFTLQLPDVLLWAALDPTLHIDEWVWDECRRLGINVINVKSYDDIASIVNLGCFYSFFAPALVVYTGYEYMRKVGRDLKFSENTKTKIIGTIHDLRDLELSRGWADIAKARLKAGCLSEVKYTAREFESERNLQMAKAKELADMYKGICNHKSLSTLVTISQYSENQIRGTLDYGARLEILYSPEKPRPAAKPLICKEINFESEPYLLVLNASRFEKNAASAVAAFDSLYADADFSSAYPDLKLVTVGINNIKDLGINIPKQNRRVITIPYLAPAQLEYVIKNAKSLIYPSFNEGFGYPPLEAMSLGVPCIVSECTSIPEICEEAAIYCNPYDIKTIASAIKTLLSKPPAEKSLKSHAAEINKRQAKDLTKLIQIICGISENSKHIKSKLPPCVF